MHGREQPKTIVMRFLKTELHYDIANRAYVEGDVMDPSSNPRNDHAQHQVMDAVQDGNVDTVTRSLDIAHAECEEILYPYTCDPVTNPKTETDDALTERTEYVIAMRVPPAFSDTTISLMSKLIHEYMVCQALYDWFRITLPSRAGDYLARMEELKGDIRSIKCRRMGRIRRKISPF